MSKIEVDLKSFNDNVKKVSGDDKPWEEKALK